MSQTRIVLSGKSSRLEGLRWESNSGLRIGRQPGMDIVLDDPSVGRQQAEVRAVGSNWIVRDLANHDRHPTLVNGTPVRRTDHALKDQDELQCGSMVLGVAVVDGAEAVPEAPVTPRPTEPPGHIRTSSAFMRVQATANNSWDQAVRRVALGTDKRPEQGQHLLMLLRTGYHVAQIGSLDDLLLSILQDVVATLGAQRGAIVLEGSEAGRLELRTVWAPDSPPQSRRCYSKTLADRSFGNGESLLCRDVAADAALVSSCSVRQGGMASIICALLRSPRKRLGVLHLDRGPLQEPFGADDFYLADAIAASVSVGIESALLVEEQRSQFVQTVTSLARAVELRDQYTGDHTHRVTDYALLLAEELRLPAAERYQLQIGTPLHDIGKIGIDDAILRKRGPLTRDEFEAMKLHTVKGAAILESILSLDPMIPIIRNHHEHWDGQGYPDRLARDGIALNARIVAVADAFDAMTSDRPYRKALGTEEAFLELQRKAGSHFDPACVEAFLRTRSRIEMLLKRGA
jgi:HD-GYP domain-containing protein (c-di-GMP phosphodiesterase class II)